MAMTSPNAGDFLHTRCLWADGDLYSLHVFEQMLTFPILAFCDDRIKTLWAAIFDVGGLRHSRSVRFATIATGRYLL